MEKYAETFNAVEVNSTHYKWHMQRTYARWAASVPPDFRFAVKMHRDVTHVHRLERLAPAREFLSSISAFGGKLGPVLIQLPPSLAYKEQYADLFEALREEHAGPLVVEPRHRTWASPKTMDMLKSLRIGVVIADPPVITERSTLCFPADLRYFRLHGSPVVYRSSYDQKFLEELQRGIRRDIAEVEETYVIFDNTASGAATINALELMGMMSPLLANGTTSHQVPGDDR